MSLVFVIKLFL